MVVVEVVTRGARVELLQRVVAPRRATAEGDGGRGEQHGDDLVEEQAATRGQHEQSIIEEPIGDALTTPVRVDAAIRLQLVAGLLANQQVARLLDVVGAGQRLAVVARLVDVARRVVIGGSVEAATGELLLQQEVRLGVELEPGLLDELVRVRLENGHRQDESQLGEHDEKGEDEEEFHQQLALLAAARPAEEACAPSRVGRSHRIQFNWTRFDGKSSGWLVCELEQCAGWIWLLARGSVTLGRRSTYR